VRDAVVDFVRTWSEKTELPSERFLGWLELARGKFFAWRQRYGKANEHNALVPRDRWLEDWEKQAILDFHERYPLGRVPTVDLHDAGPRRRGGQPIFGVPRPGQGWAAWIAGTGAPPRKAPASTSR
jgi:hypothetical protein